MSSIIAPLCLLGLILVALYSIALLGRFYASQLGPGNLTLLDYGLSFEKLVGGLVAGSAATAAYPTVLAQAEKGIERAAAGVRRSLRGSLLTAVPLVALLVAQREPLVRLWLERGRFTSEDASIVADLVLLLAPAYLAWSLAYPILYGAHALGRLRPLLAAALLGLCYAGVLGFLLGQGWALKGIAAAVSLSSCGTVVALFALSARELPLSRGTGAVTFAVKLALSTVVAAGAAAVFPVTQLPLIAQVSLGTVLGGTLYLVSLILLRVEEAVEVWAWIRFRLQDLLRSGRPSH